MFGSSEDFLFKCKKNKVKLKTKLMPIKIHQSEVLLSFWIQLPNLLRISSTFSSVSLFSCSVAPPSSLILISCEIISPKTSTGAISAAHLFNQISPRARSTALAAANFCPPDVCRVLLEWWSCDEKLFFRGDKKNQMLRLFFTPAGLFGRISFQSSELSVFSLSQAGSPSWAPCGFWFWLTCRTLRSSCTGWSGPRCSSLLPSLFWWRYLTGHNSFFDATFFIKDQIQRKTLQGSWTAQISSLNVCRSILKSCSLQASPRRFSRSECYKTNQCPFEGKEAGTAARI